MSKQSRNLRPVVSAALALVLCALAIPAAEAAGSSSKPSTPAETDAAKTPQQLAIEHYNNGIVNRDQAWKLEKKLGEAPAEKKAKLQKKIDNAFESAIREFRLATDQNPMMFQAYSGLGYALRRTGQFDAALEAYDKALTLEPNYTEAIEYRAEAYLALNRVDEAKAAYETLLIKNREHATELLDAMKKWIGERKSDPAGLSPKQVNEMERWIEQRASTMSDTVGHAIPRKDNRW